MKSDPLLTREQFKDAVFNRDGHKCVMCLNPGVDAHHILDRSLYIDGGYYLSNGATLCSECHKNAEQGLISVSELRNTCNIINPTLPSELLENVTYDKWGVPVDYNKKYARSLHSPISLGSTSDDRFMPQGYLKHFLQNDLIITEKLDGQNQSFNKLGVFARSHAAPTSLPWDKPMVNLWNLIKNDLGDLELFGESMTAIHSIEYSKLESYFYLLAVRNKGVWLSWEEVKFYANLFEFPTVPEIGQTLPLSNFIDNTNSEDVILRKWLKHNLGMSWEQYVETPGHLGGFNPITKLDCCEGLVIRCANEFTTNSGKLPVAENEFDSLFKIVREKHVQTGEHWTKNWKPATLNWKPESQYRYTEIW